MRSPVIVKSTNKIPSKRTKTNAFAYVNPKPRQQVYTKKALSPRPGACAIGIPARNAIKKQPTTAERAVQIYIAPKESPKVANILEVTKRI